MDKTIYTHRHIARCIIEATTPIAVGSGEGSLLTDAEVQRDVNNLPYIPGTSMAGIIRHALEDQLGKTEVEKYFGVQRNRIETSHGSNVIVSEARMLDENSQVIDGVNLRKSDFIENFKNLPIRQHAKIGDRGTTVDGGKFDNRVVFKGTRFYFEVEVVSDGTEDILARIIEVLKDETLRVGSGTRNGYGEFSLIGLDVKNYDLTLEKDRKAYLAKQSLFNSDDIKIKEEKTVGDNVIKYELSLQPEDFMFFGSGMGDNDVDATAVIEDFIEWKNGKATFKKEAVLIPATSLKGALSHRTAFYWNKTAGNFAESSVINDVTGSNNPAVAVLFGTDDKTKFDFEGKKISRGNVLFSDMIKECPAKQKKHNHIAIDRFTGATVDGALFSEKATYAKENFESQIIIDLNKVQKAMAGIAKKEGKKEDKAYTVEAVIGALESALKDICRGILPLGGQSNYGYGMFNGCIKKNGEELINTLKA